MRHLNFAFGSNLTADLMRGRCAGDVELVGRATLPDHRLEFVRGLATVVAAPGESVPGLLYAVTSATGLASLDRCEGVPTLYTRERVDVVLESGERVEASTYKHTGTKLEAPPAFYLRTITDGARTHGVDAAHVRAAVERARLAGRPARAGVSP